MKAVAMLLVIYCSCVGSQALAQNPGCERDSAQQRLSRAFEALFHAVRENKPAKLGTFEFSLIDKRPMLQLRDASGNRLWTAP